MVPLIVVLLLVVDVRARRTAFGRHIYAVGGNAEAARRAGINVDRDEDQRLRDLLRRWPRSAASSPPPGPTPSTPTPAAATCCCYAVGAAVIGGTSLFGGKGRVLDAVLGGAVVAVIDNGMGLMGYSAGVKYMVTGSVLLLAARRGRAVPQAGGRHSVVR